MILRLLLALVPFVWANPANADCLLVGESTVECDPTLCLIVTFETASPVFVPVSGDIISAEMLAIGDGVVVARPQNPLPEGSYRFGGPEGVAVDVSVRPRFAQEPSAIGRHVPGRGGCRDTLSLPIPYVAKEEMFRVSVLYGRPVLSGARADFWLLRPGDPLPAGSTTGFATSTAASGRRRVLNSQLYNAPIRRDTHEFTIDIYWEELAGIDRVAVQVFEPDDVVSPVLWVDVDDRELYAGCTCESSARTNQWIVWMWPVFAFWGGMRRLRRRRYIPRLKCFG